MITGGKGGGNTITGLIYEGKVDLATFLNKQNGYLVYNSEVYYNGELIARLFKKHKLYKYLEENGVDWRKHLSKKLLPDDCIYVIINNNYALDAGFSPAKDSLLIENAESPYVNVLSVKEGNEETPEAKALAAALSSKAVADYISST